MSFGEVAARVFTLYDDREYERALQVVREALPTYPDEEADLTFWEACLLARAGDPERALMVLEEAVDRDMWWPPGVLDDEDLDPVRSLPGWKPVLDHCSALVQQKRSLRPAPLVRDVPHAAGTVVAIQGARADQEVFASTWERATPKSWQVITPAGLDPEMSGRWIWPRSLEASSASVEADLASLEWHRPLVLTGFSIGAAIACHLITSRSLPVDGLIAVAPSSRNGFEEIREVVGRQVPSLILCGEQDFRHHLYEELLADIGKQPGVTMKIMAGLGHEFPVDLDSRVTEFLHAVAPPVP